MSPRVLDSAVEAARWLSARARGRLRSDSRLVQPGDVFIAWPGATRDGRAFVAQALTAGAAACLVEAEGVDAFALDGTRVAALRDLKSAAGAVASAWFGEPSQRLSVLAVTGTNGKTSTAWWLAQALSACGQRAGVVGTLGVGEPPAVQSTGLTTPDPVTLQAAFADFVGADFAACAIEASSIGIVSHRMTGTHIAVALFTNFTQDHLDFHGDMDSYWAAKRQLFSWPGLRAAVVNVDDARGAALADELAAPGLGLDVWTVSASQPARLRAQHVVYRDGGLCFEVIEDGRAVPLRSQLIGDYNVHNLLVVLGGLRAQGVPLAQAVASVPALQPVPGRMQRVSAPAGREDLPAVVVDYAHTPDALEKVLLSLRPLAQARRGALWCVFGCGGDRDAVKRPLMGALAAALADHVVVTSDNPRSEAPEAIVDQILAGLSAHSRARARRAVDRHTAISVSVREAQPADVVLIAGKGHEDYQEIAGQRLPFSDLSEAQRALEAR